MTLFSVRRGAPLLALLALACLSGPLLAGADTCATAVVIPGSGPFPYAAAVVDTTGNTDDSGDPAFPCNVKFPAPAPAGAVSHSAWYTFTPAATGQYKIDTLGSTPGGSYDTIVGLFTGSCGSLTAVSGACNDDTAGSFQSAVTATLNGGTTYYVLVSGLGSRNPFNQSQVIPSSGGQLQLNVSTVAVSYPYTYIIPSTVHTSTYVSDLSVVNPSGADGSFVLQFLGHGNFNDGNPPASQPSNAPTTIRANGSVQFNDVLLSAFGLDPASGPYGSILVKSTVRLLTGARTYTNASGQNGTFGQFSLGVDTGTGLLGLNESGRLIGVREDATTRTNIVVFTHIAQSCNVQYELLNSTGDHPIGGTTVIRVTPPATMVQVNGLRNLFGISQDIVNMSVKITNMTAGCQLGAVAYVIDGGTTAGTNDPFAIPLQK